MNLSDYISVFTSTKPVDFPEKDFISRLQVDIRSGIFFRVVSVNPLAVSSFYQYSLTAHSLLNQSLTILFDDTIPYTDFAKTLITHDASLRHLLKSKDQN